MTLDTPITISITVTARELYRISKETQDLASAPTVDWTVANEVLYLFMTSAMDTLRLLTFASDVSNN